MFDVGDMFFNIMRNADWKDYDQDYVWCDKNGKFYTLEDINNRYLLAILNFIYNGGGYINIMNEENISKLYNEAIKRELKPKHKLKDIIEAYKEKVLNCYIINDNDINDTY